MAILLLFWGRNETSKPISCAQLSVGLERLSSNLLEFAEWGYSDEWKRISLCIQH
jgi:hypothetical protein